MNANNGMVTSVWGPSLWHFLHSISFNYPLKPTKKQKVEFVNFILSVESILPCSHCRDNFPKNLKAVPLTKHALKNRNNFSRWMYRFHSHVNTMLGKKTTQSYDEIKKLYETFRATKCNDNQHKKKNKKTKTEIENGCTSSTRGLKCVLRIIPKEMKCPSISVSTNNI
tara:strand:- start:2305 stop:2808 length:504 start_codon:yes stop_codon:yes gene_type:complete